MPHIHYINIAANISQSNKGQTFPNPSVGCVIVKDGMIVAKAVTGNGGSPHAERVALAIAGDKARGSDLYVTLEPCSHQGRNPPCVQAIIKSGIRRVFYGISDPNPLVNGEGVKELQQAGIEINAIHTDKTEELHKEFCYLHSYKMPYVTVKIALSKDNKSAYLGNKQQWITCEQSRHDVHLLRYKADAVLTSIETVLADDPRLNVRIAGLKKERGVVLLLDSKLRVPLMSNLVQYARRGIQDLIIFTTQEANTDKVRQIEDLGVEVVIINAQDSRVELQEMLHFCAKKKLASLLVEAGATLSKEIIKQKLAQELIIYQSNDKLGNDGVGEFKFETEHGIIKTRKIKTDCKKLIRVGYVSIL